MNLNEQHVLLHSAKKRYGHKCTIYESKDDYEVNGPSSPGCPLRILWKKQPFVHDHINQEIYKAVPKDGVVDVEDIVRESKWEDPKTPALNDWMYEVKYCNECVETTIDKNGRAVKKDPRIKEVPYSRLVPKNDNDILGNVTPCIFGSKRSLLRSAFGRWYSLEDSCEAFRRKHRLCNGPSEAAQKLSRQTTRFIFDKRSKKKKSVDILKALNLNVPKGWDETSARLMFWKIYVANASNEIDNYGGPRDLVKRMSESAHSIERALLPRYQMWLERKAGAEALRKELKSTIVKQTKLLNSRIPGSGNNIDGEAFSINELYANDETETNMEELNLQIDRAAKEREYWRQKVIQYQVKLDQMIQDDSGKSMHEIIRQDTRQNDVHETLNATDMTWELQ